VNKPNIFGYRLNEAVLKEIRNSYAPEEFCLVLERNFMGRYFGSREDYSTALMHGLPNDADEEFIQLVIKKSRRLSLHRICQFISSRIGLYFPVSAVVPSPVAYIATLPAVLFCRIRSRFYFYKLLAYLRKKQFVRSLSNSNAHGYIHNFKQMLDFSTAHRNRTERLMSVLKAMDGLDFKRLKLLSVGPRNEGELLLLKSHGFCNISSIDLFTYSPLIEPMDMNRLHFESDSFDIYYSSAVIKYSPDIKKTISESIRVTRNGGLMAYMFMYGGHNNLIPEGSVLDGGAKELVDLYSPFIDRIHYWNEFKYAEDDFRAALIFSIRK